MKCSDGRVGADSDGLSATEAVERVELLEELKRISGIVDDRGKCEQPASLSSVWLIRVLVLCSHLRDRRGHEEDGTLHHDKGAQQHHRHH